MREATLCYPVVDDEVLLIEKRRGVGAGNVNGPGGKLEPGETPRECVVREVREEVAVRVDPEKMGELHFTFGDDPFMFVHVFRADDPTGDPEPSEEADPFWCPVDDIPYDRMWEDDRYWVPHLLEGTQFRGDAVFDEDGDELLEWDLETDVELDGHAPSHESFRTS
ncbi:8-oxo-dGTP diphosphatase [Halobacterium litoreum]|uniref:Oxidized purine nucleoside triphosphate hydrolase n=1 Tax=Halobacterium litoreum TaxID=2039234 RepID=A0ABD5NH98_9EURY|nr:8-oxo-dGTP diphosphatase [Halobacterium litoreum]UHH12644.1 8-oxo-dGTP diphosphatase [Halobacterium litoreum]